MSAPGRVTRAEELAARKSTWAVLTLTGAVLGLVIGLVTQPGPSHPSARPRAAAPAPKPAPAEHGFRVIVPSIGADAPVIPEGATGGELDVPSSVHVVGWWDGVSKSSSGTVHEQVAAPGQSGVALLAGHVDSAAQGHGVFYRLRQARPGDAVTVIDANDNVTHWEVTAVQVVLKSALPYNLFVDSGPPQLALVSCGGPFDPASGHYLDNVIAWAVPVPG